jgi:hypothetical protein
MTDHIAAKSMRVRHLAREISTATELALVAMAPSSIVEPLALASGLLAALTELPLDTEALRVRAQDAVDRAERSLAEWQRWEQHRKVTA